MADGDGNIRDQVGVKGEITERANKERRHFRVRQKPRVRETPRKLQRRPQLRLLAHRYAPHLKMK